MLLLVALFDCLNITFEFLATAGAKGNWWIGLTVVKVPAVN
jgi:hypothetical protein